MSLRGWVVMTGSLAGSVVLVVGCGQQAHSPRTDTSASRALIRQGATILAQAGCLACHQIGNQGNDGPGPELTTVGARLTAAQITRALDDPREPMPTYRALPANQHRSLVAYLASLRAPRDAIPAPKPLVPPAPSPVPKSQLCRSKKLYQQLVRLFPSHRARLTRQFRAACGAGWKP